MLFNAGDVKTRGIICSEGGKYGVPNKLLLYAQEAITKLTILSEDRSDLRTGQHRWRGPATRTLWVLFIHGDATGISADFYPMWKSKT